MRTTVLGQQIPAFAFAGVTARRLLVAAVGLALADSAAAGTIQCPPGSSSFDGNEPCNPCVEGTYQPDSGQMMCLDADPGNFVDITGATAQTQCTAGAFQPNSGSSACNLAQPGFFVPLAGSPDQTACQEGTFEPDAGSTACDPAPAGSFVPVTQATAPTACAAGTFTMTSGQSACDPAPPGSFVASSGATAAELCALGTYQPDSGQSQCLAAPRGGFVGVTGATSFQNCAAGSFQNQPGQSACDAASPGFFVATVGATSAMSCDPGTYQPASGQTACLSTDPGFFTAGSASPNQLACAFGTFQPLSGQSGCNDAPSGSFVGQTGATQATECSLGTFQPLSGQSVCNAAAPGFFVDMTGATASQACTAGFYQPQSGQAACLPADPGFFVAGNEAIDQTACARGRFQPQSAQTACTVAPAGKFVAQTGASAATDCALGTFQPNAGSSSCDQAAAGTFVAITGATQSQSCAAGTFQPLVGQSECNQAPAGSFVDIAGATAAQECAVGRFQPGTGSTACLDAPPGTFVDITGATEAAECAAGSFQSTAGQSACTDAPVGAFVAITGATGATSCPAGSVSFGGSIACRQAPTPGPNVVAPLFASSEGRGGTVQIGDTLLLPQGLPLTLDVSNQASAVGAADPLTRLTLNSISSSGVDGDATAQGFAPGSTLDEGQNLPIDLALSANRLGQVSIGVSVETDEGADLGADGADFEFEFRAAADGNDVSVSILSDRAEVAAGGDFTLWLEAGNPGRTGAVSNQLAVQIGAGASCNWTAQVDPGAVASAGALNASGSDTVDLPPRARVLYRGQCVADSGATGSVAFDATLQPDPALNDVDGLNNSDSGLLNIVAGSSGTANLSVRIISQSNFWAPDSPQQVVFEITNDGPDDVVGGSFSALVFGSSLQIGLTCSDQPGVDCGTLRQVGRGSYAVDAPVSLLAGQSMTVTLDIRVRTLEAQTLQVLGLTAVPPGWNDPQAGNNTTGLTATGAIFNDSFELP